MKSTKIFRADKKYDDEAGNQLEKPGATHNIDRQQVRKLPNERSGMVEDVSL